MKNTCPKCDTAYNVTATAVGRKFTCKNCGTPVVVTADGLDYQTPPAAAEPAPAATGAAFDFDAGDEDERKPARSPKKVGKPAKSRSDGDEREEDAPRKSKGKQPKDEADDEDDADALPARKARTKGKQKNLVMDFLLFREFIAPLFVKLIFLLSIASVVLGGLGAVGFGLISGKVELILGGFCGAVVFIPLSIFMVRVYCELVLLGFSVYDRLGEIKNLLEKGEATTPGAPPSPPTP